MKDVNYVVKGVLTDFLGRESELDVSYNDMFMGFILDEDEIEILSNAITEALEREKKNEGQN